MVILGQTYLARNIGFASGVTLGLSASVGGLISPLVGWAADRWGVGPSLQILWIVAAIGCFFAFLVPVPPSMIKKKHEKFPTGIISSREFFFLSSYKIIF